MMLAHIEQAMDDGVARLEATCDERGVPVSVYIDYSENVTDEEFGWAITSLTLTP